MEYSYAADMSVNAEAWAKLTNIAAGWLQSSEMPTYQIGCCRCGFFYRWTISISELDEYDTKIKNGSAEDFVERRVELTFLRAARKQGCPHWEGYLSMRESPEITCFADNLTLDALILTNSKNVL